jgi:hypothetical protein
MKKFEKIEEGLFGNIVKLREEVINNVILKDDNYFNLKMSGFCANMSFLVHNYLRANGKRSYFVVNEQHCFVILEENLIDLTATQFLQKRGYYYDKVYIDFRKNTGAWVEDSILYTDEEIKKYFDNSNWPVEQTPFFFIETNLWYKNMIEDMKEFQMIL